MPPFSPVLWPPLAWVDWILEASALVMGLLLLPPGILKLGWTRGRKDEPPWMPRKPQMVKLEGPPLAYLYPGVGETPLALRHEGKLSGSAPT